VEHNSQTVGAELGEFGSEADRIEPPLEGGDATASVPFSRDWQDRAGVSVEPAGIAAPLRPQVEPGHGGSGWVALVGSLGIVAAALAVSVLLWTELPERLHKPVAEHTALPGLASTPTAAPTAVSNPGLVLVRTDALARAVARAATFAAPAALVPTVPHVAPPAAVAEPPAEPSVPTPAVATARPVPTSVERQPSQVDATGGRTAIGQVLDTYRRAFNAFDAPAIVALWPGADADTLSRTFSTLRYQSLSFNGCQVRQAESDRALATCGASISEVDRSGDPAVRHRRETWTFALRRVADGWTIERVTMH
jgi:hypothetical protein